MRTVCRLTGKYRADFIQAVVLSIKDGRYFEKRMIIDKKENLYNGFLTYQYSLESYF